jgi:hypothetical protein
MNKYNKMSYNLLNACRPAFAGSDFAKASAFALSYGGQAVGQAANLSAEASAKGDTGERRPGMHNPNFIFQEFFIRRSNF